MIPPIASVRCTLSFRSPNFTWGETYWRIGGGSTDPTFDDVLVLGVALRNGGLCDRRVQLLGAGVELIRVETSRDNVFRDSEVSTAYAQWAQPAGALPVQQVYNRAYCGLVPIIDGCEPAAEPQVVLRVRMQSGARRRRTLFLGGIPQALDRPGGNYPFPSSSDPFSSGVAGTFNAAFAAFITEVLAGAWGYVGTDYALQHPVSNITGNPTTGIVTVVCSEAHGLGPADTALVFRPTYFPGSYNFHGQVEVFETPTLDTFTVKVPNLGPINYWKGGVVRGPAYRAFYLFTDVIGAQVAERKRGNAELAIRGRSKSRKLYVS